MNARPEPSRTIDYPREWHYRIIGSDLAELHRCVIEVVGHRPHRADVSNASSGGKYVSMQVTLDVETLDDRDAVFLAFKTHPAVKVVL